MIKKRKVAIVGCGFIGTSLAYALINQGDVNEIALIDINSEKAQGEQMDLSHGLSFYPKSNCKIKAGGYEECKDADIVAIMAGTPQIDLKKSRLEDTDKTTRIVKDITENVVKSGFDGIFIVASNPVDLMAYVIKKVSNFPKQKIIGTGTLLDTARLRYYLSEYLNVSSKDMNAYVLGEHGDSSFAVWSNAYVGCKKVQDIFKEKNYDLNDLDTIYTKAKRVGFEIVSRKKATYYGIGMVTARIISAIFNDEHIILPVSSYLEGEYEQNGLFIGVPSVITSEGINQIVKINLDDNEKIKMQNSANILKGIISDSVDKILNEK